MRCISCRGGCSTSSEERGREMISATERDNLYVHLPSSPPPQTRRTGDKCTRKCTALSKGIQCPFARTDDILRAVFPFPKFVENAAQTGILVSFTFDVSYDALVCGDGVFREGTTRRKQQTVPNMLTWQGRPCGPRSLRQAGGEPYRSRCCA